jgi:23S rRNA (cytosine1962-C5)-methyltransferase
VADRTAFEEANVFDWLKTQTFTPPHERLLPKYDLVVLDPPSFTRNRAAVPDALRGYKEIHLRALKLLKPGGVLATFCCSHHVDARLFEDVILAAAFDCRRVLRRVAAYGQSPDHPVLPSIPETEYLKGYAYELAR